MKKIMTILFGVVMAGSIAGAAQAETGKQIYSAHCAACHGASREGGMGPSLIDAKSMSGAGGKSRVVGIIRNGIPRSQMPAWGGRLSAADIGLVADYLFERPAPATGLKAVLKEPSERYPELANFKLPKGFNIAVYSDAVPNARAIAISDSGIVFVSSRKVGKIYALVDSDKDHVIKKVVTVAEGLDSPIGLVMLNGSLFVSEMTRVIRFDDIEKSFDQSPGYKVVKDDFPKEKWHGEKIIKVGPDGKLYVPIGADCNVCDREEDLHSKIYRMNPDGSEFEVFAKGVRNSVGFAWDPRTSEMWFTDNNRDEMGDNLPSCELNHAPKAGMHFGFPYCHAGMLPDPVFGKNRSCDEFTPPAALLGPHTAPLGLNFYTGNMFPAQYRNNLFIAEHGSWNRENKIGYRVNLITIVNNKVASDTPFLDGFLKGEEVLGRPIDVAFMQDGSMLISDDHAGRIYRVTYSAPAARLK